MFKPQYRHSENRKPRMDSLIVSLTCQINLKNNPGDVHLLDNPRILPCCRRSACQKCILKMLSTKSGTPEYLFDCVFCQKISRIKVVGDEIKLESDDQAMREIKKNLNEINRYLLTKLDHSLKNIEDRVDSREKNVEKRRAFIENEIHLQVEALKVHLDQLEVELCERLENSCRNVSSNMKQFEQAHLGDINDIKLSIENLKSNTASYLTASKSTIDPNFLNILQIQCVNKCQSHLSDLTTLHNLMNDMVGELRFEPNIDLPDLSIIGDLRQVQEINLKEQFQSIKSQSQITRIKSLPGSMQQIPISPRYVCIPDPYHLFFTDSLSKHLIQLTLQSGDFVRSTNLNGQFKNPDGICVNTKTGYIYVSDSDLNIIFKLDSNFNLLKKIGHKDLKWPRAMAFDSDTSHDNRNPNRLYVCDYSNQRVAIFNEHDQLRDCLTVTINEDRVPSFNRLIANGNGYINGSNGNGYRQEGQAFESISVSDDNKFCPMNVLVTKTFVYVTDDWTGGNCIRIFDKTKHTLLRNIGDLNAWNPLGLIVDDLGNIFTLARLYYETGQTHLFCFDKDGNMLYKTNLNLNSEYMSDMVVDKFSDKTNHRIICTGDKKLHIFQF